MRRLDTHSLACLDALISEGHVSRAAHRIGISQPAMSVMLSRLREVFHDPLLVRTSQGMTPTPRAMEVAEKAREVLELIEHALSDASETLQSPVSMTLRIRILNSLSSFLLPTLVARLDREMPWVRISIQHVDVRQTVGLLERNECDLAIGIPPAVSPTLHASNLFPSELCCIVRRGHPGISAALSPKQFVKYPHVVLSGGPVPVSTIEAAIDQKLRSLRLSRQIGVRVPDLTVTPGIIAKTNFIATLPKRIVAHFAVNLDLLLLPPPFALAELYVLMVWHERTHRDPTHRRVRQMIRAIAKDVPSSGKLRRAS